MHQRAGLTFWTVFATVVVAGCGGDPAAGRAGHTVAVGWRAVARAEESIGAAERDPGDEQRERQVRAARGALASAHDRLLEAERVVQIWQDTDTGSMGWTTVLPCLALALANLRDAMLAAGLPEPEELDTAELMAEEGPAHSCVERHGRPQ